MGLVWRLSESVAFQTRIKANLGVWEQALHVWDQRLAGLALRMGIGPNTELNGAAWQAANTLFMNHIYPLVLGCESVCTWLRMKLDIYASAESRLTYNGANYLNEDALQHAMNLLDDAIYDATHAWFIPLPWRNDDDDIAPTIKQRDYQKDRLERLRTFSRTVKGLFDDESDAIYTIACGIESVHRGSLTTTGDYKRPFDDQEDWLVGLNWYRKSHPIHFPGIFENGKQYGGDQGWLVDNNMERWRKMSADDKELISEAIRKYYPNLDDYEIELVLKQMNEYGCRYVAEMNSLAEHYADDPHAFFLAFGFSLYRPDGSIDYEHLFIDYWCSVQKYRTAIDPTGRTEGQVPVGIDSLNTEYLERYLTEHGVSVERTTVTSATSNDFKEYLKRGNVIVSVSPFKLHPVNGDPPTTRTGGHSMTVTGTGVDSAGRSYLEVSSWGEEYHLYPSDYGNGTSFDLDGDGKFDVDTNGNGFIDAINPETGRRMDYIPRINLIYTEYN